MHVWVFLLFSFLSLQTYFLLCSSVTQASLKCFSLYLLSQACINYTFLLLGRFPYPLAWWLDGWQTGWCWLLTWILKFIYNFSDLGSFAAGVSSDSHHDWSDSGRLASSVDPSSSNRGVPFAHGDLLRHHGCCSSFRWVVFQLSL